MIAIVIPYFKLKFFEQTLNSLVDQNNKNFNVYIGNDNSPESPDKLLNAYNDKLNLFYKKFENNLGGTSLTQHWERCIELVKSENWIMLLGDDDFLGENVIDSFYENKDKFVNKSNVVRFASRTILIEKNRKSDICINPLWETPYTAYCRKLNGVTRSSLSEYVFSKSSYKKNRFTDYPLAFYSDDKAWLDFSDGKLIFSINTAIVNITISAESISGREDNNKLKNEARKLFFGDLFKKYLNLFDNVCRHHIVRAYELSLLEDRKISLVMWTQLYWEYLINFKWKHFKKLNIRFLKTILFNRKTPI